MSDPFRQLEPPPGGWAATRERIVDDERRRFQRLAVLALAAIFAVVFVFVARPQQEHPGTQLTLDRSVHPDLAMLEQVDDPVRIAPNSRGHAGLLRVETDSPDVIFYHVLTTPSQTPKNADGE